VTCKCGNGMKCVYVWDDVQVTDHAYNLYVCAKCGMMVWNHAGKQWTEINGRHTFDAPRYDE